MARFISRCIVVLALVIGLVEPLAAKGKTTKVVVSGGGLPASVELTSSDALVNVFVGAYPTTGTLGCVTPQSFVGAEVSEPDRSFPRYTVSFWGRLPQTAKEAEVMYRVRYVLDKRTGEAFVYVPGPGDEEFELNRMTVKRPGEGKWHRAATTWALAIASAL